MNSNLPPGMEDGDAHFYPDPDDGDCVCGHVKDEHHNEWGECDVDDCGCILFEQAEGRPF